MRPFLATLLLFVLGLVSNAGASQLGQLREPMLRIENGAHTATILDLYLSERVKELTSGRQTPTTAKPQTIADFPVAVKK